jgi:hypothetical protein
MIYCRGIETKYPRLKYPRDKISRDKITNI